jgi:peptidoglycan/LPS O-acetylase OafA/YrhL
MVLVEKRGMNDAQRFHNFDAMRLAAAASVIFSHAFLIADGHDQNEPFVRMTGHILGIHGVFVFLIISGFLVTQSLVTSSSLRNFAWKRLLRIYPALCACGFVCAFLIAPFFSELSVRQYFASLIGMKYATKVLLLYDVYEIPTVQFYNDGGLRRLGYIVNGSLWTIASEIYCYIFLFIFAALEFISLPVVLFGLFTGSGLLGLSLVLKLPFSEATSNLIYTLPSFCAGIAIYLINTKFTLSRTVAIGFGIGVLLVAPTGQLMVLFPILAAYPVIYFGLSRVQPFGDATKFGDFSYGMYLYGWPIEEIIRGVTGPSLSGWSLCLVSLPLALACGWLSWHLVEKRALVLRGVVPPSGPG